MRAVVQIQSPSGNSGLFSYYVSIGSAHIGKTGPP